jgi:hypothetical protein
MRSCSGREGLGDKRGCLRPASEGFRGTPECSSSSLSLNYQFARPHVRDDDSEVAVGLLDCPSGGQRVADVIKLIIHHAIDEHLEGASLSFIGAVALKLSRLFHAARSANTTLQLYCETEETQDGAICLSSIMSSIGQETTISLSPRS